MIEVDESFVGNIDFEVDSLFADYDLSVHKVGN